MTHPLPPNFAKLLSPRKPLGDRQIRRKFKYSVSFESEDNESDCYKELNNWKKVIEKRIDSKTPKIFYGTRTHRQIEQVVREFKKTAYRDKRMTILSSREHTCIQNSTKNKTELCADLLDPKKQGHCPYYNKDFHQRPLSTYHGLQKNGVQTPWDIEDFVEIGRNLSTCPYFSARDLMGSAEIIFCPYNYIIDPDIRESLDINLNGEIIVLDEAHNIEDICRDVGSKSFREDYLLTAATDLEMISEVRKEHKLYQDRRKVYRNLANYLKSLVKFVNSQRIQCAATGSLKARSEYWTAEQFYELLKMPIAEPLGDFDLFESCFSDVMMDYNSDKEDAKSWQIVSENTKKILEKLLSCLQIISSPTSRNDFRVCIVEGEAHDLLRPVQRNGWISTKIQQRIRILELKCMNSSIIFSQLALTSRAIILASGTLSPTTSFASELGTEFPFVLSAQHIIPKERVYARCLSRGPTGMPLKANFQNINQWTFQEEIGRLILSVCKSVPHGVLCFFSSYNALMKHMKRWEECDEKIWENLEKLKHVFVEPRFNTHLAEVMQNYRDAIKQTADAPNNKINGALLLAVFRGKVAEGIDFSDDEARCVISIGIPYSVRTDPEIEMKWAYNDLHMKSKKLLKGGEWYAVQAFRALNQALGRCVRHQNDWGAVLLVDERLLMDSNTKYLPRWIQAMLRRDSNFNLDNELQTFVKRLKEKEIE